MRNYQHLVFLVNFDSFFGVRPSGKDAKKCLRLSPRPIMLAGTLLKIFSKVTFVLARMPDQDFLLYLSELFGTEVWSRINLLVPEKAETEPLNLANSLLKDQGSLYLLRSNNDELFVTGLISTPDVNQVAETLGARQWPNISKGGSDMVRSFNNKFWFKNACKRHGIRVPPGEFTQEPTEAALYLTRALLNGQSSMIRLTRAAGGLGNLKIEPGMTGISEIPSIAQVANLLESKIGEEKLRTGTLVEPVLKIVRSFAVEVDIQDSGIKVVAIVERSVVNDSESEGSFFPAQVDNFVADAVRQTMDVMGNLHSLGYRGRADCDWGIEILPGEFQRLVAFEINARWTATGTLLSFIENFGQSVGLELCGMSCDYLSLSHNSNLESMLDFLTREGLLWNESQGRGVVITVPPSSSAVSYIIVSTDSEDVFNINRKVRTWAIKPDDVANQPEVLANLVQV